MFEELELSRFPEIRDLRIDLNNHLLKSPCFLKCSQEELENWLNKVEAGDRRTFVVCGTDGKVLAYIDITGEGENILQITLAAFSERFSEENAVEGEFILILLCILLSYEYSENYPVFVGNIEKCPLLLGKLMVSSKGWREMPVINNP